MSTGFDWSWHIRAQDCIAQAALTNSKRPECLVKGIYPTHLKRGQGCHVWDTLGKRYIDFIGGLGTNILGYGNTDVDHAIVGALGEGYSLSLGSCQEVETAEKLKELFPWVSHLKFLKTGSEACSAAIRIARTKTGRKRVLSEGYHGWHDGFVSLTPPALGMPSESDVKLLQDQAIDETVAAVILEPVMTDYSDARIAWLREIKERCNRVGAVLIFDEIITGFRFPKFSVTNYYGIEPDLICLGKAIGNGMPLAVVAGKSDIMNCGEYFVSSTYAGERLSLVAAHKTMTLLQTKYSIHQLWEKGSNFQKAFNRLGMGQIGIQGYPTRGVFVGDPFIKALLWQEACKAGILFGPSFFFNFAHMDVVDWVLSSLGDIITRIRLGQVKLEGEMPVSPFAAKMREIQV